MDGLKKNYEQLAQAIITQAISDYKHSKNAEMKQSIESFFRSEWFMVLTNIDGERLIKKLRREDWK